MARPMVRDPRAGAGLKVTALLLTAAALTACHREPGFDERYASATAAIRAKASALDADIATRDADDGASAPPRADAPRLGPPSRSSAARH